MQTLLRRITLGIGTGAAIAIGSAGCASSLELSGDNPDANELSDAGGLERMDANVPGPRDANVTEPMDATQHVDAMPDTHVPPDLDGSAAMTDAAIDSETGLPPFPLSVECTSDDAGVCCYAIACLVVEGSCPDVTSAGSPVYPPPPYLAHCDVSGPFAPNPAYPYTLWPEPDGNCCYVMPTGLLGEGRPLIVDTGLIVANILVRSDWLVG